MGFLKDFKAFAMKGNVIDMAVGVIIGGAFGKIVTSIVNDIIMPPIGLLVGGVNFTDLKWIMKPEVLAEDGTVETAAVTLNYGNFLQQTFDFLIIAFSIFIMIKVITRLTEITTEVSESNGPRRDMPAPLLPDIRFLSFLRTQIRSCLRAMSLWAERYSDRPLSE